MINRSKFKKFRQHICSLAGAVVVIALYRMGVSGNSRVVFTAIAIAMCIYGIWFAIDRIIGLLFPIVVDLQSVTLGTVDRSDPNHIRITMSKAQPVIDIEINNNDEVELLQVGDLKMRHSEREFCYMRLSKDRYIRSDPEIAYIVTGFIRKNRGSVKVTGAGYQVT